jgi:hypothetical protein
VQRVYTKIRGGLVSAVTALYTIISNSHHLSASHRILQQFLCLYLCKFANTLHLPILKGLVLDVLLLLGSFLRGSTHALDSTRRLTEDDLL